jgi:hypothetical protein
VWDDTMLVRHDPPVEATLELIAEVQRRLAAIGRYRGEASGLLDDATRSALEAWAGEVNLEGRIRDDDLLSQHLVFELRDITPEVT